MHEIDFRAESTLHFLTEGNQKLLVFGLEIGNAAAIRIHFEEFRLPQGGTLRVYGVGRDGTILSASGPYTGSGPLSSGEFWSRAVAGSRAYVELRLRSEVASLPFSIHEVAESNGVEGASRSEEFVAPAEAGIAMFRGMPVEYRSVRGYAVWEGDIILGRLEEVEPYDKEKHTRESLSIKSSTYRWPGAAIPFTIDSNLPSQSRITDAVNHWNTNLSGYLRLVPRTSESAYITFIRSVDAGTCSSYVGYLGFASQPVEIGDSCGTGNVIHEIGHAVGLYHEHTRSDRNTYVVVNSANIDPNASSNFTVVKDGTNLGQYDYGSIMHYGAYAFSINSQPTITTIPAGISIGQRSALSAGDINGVKTIYGLTSPPSSTVITMSFSSSPSGRTLLVDGLPLVTPSSVSWQSGSVHSVTAPNETPAGVQYVFTKWSDNGAQTHTVTAPSTSATLTASYRVRYLITAQSSDPVKGSVAKTPVSADEYYDLNSTVTINAVASTNNCFNSWSGILPVANTTAQLTVTQPYAVIANFQAGAVTVPPSISVEASRGQYSIGVSATGGCVWKAFTSTSWISLGTSAGSASGIVPITVDRNNGKTARTGPVVVNGMTVVVNQAGR